MQGQRGRSERHSGVFLDMVHLILGIAIVIPAVLSFINPREIICFSLWCFAGSIVKCGKTEYLSLRPGKG